MENWVDIIGYEGHYQVSDLGRIRSVDRIVYGRNGKSRVLRSKILKPHTARGYKRVRLYNNSVGKVYLIHRLMASSFFNTDISDKVIDHIDNNPLNNTITNLQITTIRYNLSKDKKGKSKYTGVSKCGNKWRSMIYRSWYGGNIHLGLFNTEEEAHKAYQKALLSE